MILLSASRVHSIKTAVNHHIGSNKIQITSTSGFYLPIPTPLKRRHEVMTVSESSQESVAPGRTKGWRRKAGEWGSKGEELIRISR